MSDENRTGVVDGTNKSEGIGNVVAEHYNTLESSFEHRNVSKILHLRNLNNWIKSMLIEETITKLERPHGFKIRVLDMCCGKGGDLLKWRKYNINYLICSDIADVSLQQCKERFEDLRSKSSNLYQAEFISADLTKVRLRSKYVDPSMKIDIVSCQFSFHYCFETIEQAETMLLNATETLQKGGLFIGTIPNANRIVQRLRAGNGISFGNDIYNITFDEPVKNPFPLFGAKYHFQLDGVVNCPEYLVYFPVFVKLAEKYNLKLVKKENFDNYFKEKLYNGKFLLNRMKGLEVYPPMSSNDSASKDPNDYSHAKKYQNQNPSVRIVGTLSKKEWEVFSLYMIFIFEKM